MQVPAGVHLGYKIWLEDAIIQDWRIIAWEEGAGIAKHLFRIQIQNPLKLIAGSERKKENRKIEKKNK